MRFEHLIQEVFYRPWLIRPSAHAAIRDIMLAKLAGDEPRRQDGTDICGERVEVEQAELIDGIYHIPIGGVIGRKLSSWERGAGAVDVMEISRELKYADDSNRVKAILLDIDSPGGVVSGTPELADVVASMSKPVAAYTAGMMDSAAYWIGSSADAIYATKSADIGSIGVYMPFFDESARYEKAGVKVELFGSGPFKGMGFPGTSLTEAQREQLKAEVDAIFSEFKGHVREMRGDVPDMAMQGQSMLAMHALGMGLIDGLVEDKDEVSALLKDVA